MISRNGSIILKTNAGGSMTTQAGKSVTVTPVVDGVDTGTTDTVTVTGSTTATAGTIATASGNDSTSYTGSFSTTGTYSTIINAVTGNGSVNFRPSAKTGRWNVLWDAGGVDSIQGNSVFSSEDLAAGGEGDADSIPPGFRRVILAERAEGSMAILLPLAEPAAAPEGGRAELAVPAALLAGLVGWRAARERPAQAEKRLLGDLPAPRDRFRRLGGGQHV